jgi:hypothetical protein
VTGEVCLNGDKIGPIGFQTRTDLQNHAIGWLRKRCNSPGGGTVVGYPQIWITSVECRIRPGHHPSATVLSRNH